MVVTFGALGSQGEMATQAETVCRLKETLRQVMPPVWRRIEVPSNIKLSGLVDVLEAAMGCGTVTSVTGGRTMWSSRRSNWHAAASRFPSASPESGPALPRTVAARGGYGNLLAALGDPTHEEHEELTEWVEIDFESADFDAGEATADMRSARPLKGW